MSGSLRHGLDVEVEQVGVRLTDGRFAAYTNVYPFAWPPPERLVAFEVGGAVALAEAEKVEQARELDPEATIYVKVKQSQLPGPLSGIVRGAEYKVIADE